MPEEQKQEDETLENIVAFVVFGIIVLLAVGFWNNWWGLFNPGTNGGVDGQMVHTEISGEPMLGDSEAPVTIVQYSDFQCTSCRDFYSTVFPRVRKELIDTGRVRFFFKQFPLTGVNPNALEASMAAECAYRQEKFWPYHDLLYETNKSITRSSLEGLAGQAGLDTERFKTCMESNSTKPEVQEDYAQGVKSSVPKAAPAFIIGESRFPFVGELLVGKKPYSDIEESVQKLE